jgi:hypothetical protein
MKKRFAIQIREPVRFMQRWSREEWIAKRAEHQAQVDSWTCDRLQRRKFGQKHPVEDFLFEYYPFRPAQLARWTPGPGVVLEETSPAETDFPNAFHVWNEVHVRLGPFPDSRREFLSWLGPYLQAIAERPARHVCLGLHEWAMVYRVEERRHGQVPLRLTQAEVNAVVEAHPLQCTHFDAYRFFTPEAIPRNRYPLTRADTMRHDQPGCVHANMDLYKWAMKLAPWCPSDLVRDTFALAREARVLDMQASPYDLQAWGIVPIPLESREGREEYIVRQREIAVKAEPLRNRLRDLVHRLTSPDQEHPL